MPTGTEKRAAVANWLNSQGIRDPAALSETEYAELLSLLAPHKGFGIFWSLLMHTRQTYAVLLTNVNLTTPRGVSEGSQFQGVIKAIDDFRELVLSIADPVGSSDHDFEQRN